MTKALVSGAAGALTTTLLHEAVRRAAADAPRIDLLGMQALAKLLRALGAEVPTGSRLYTLTLLGDVVSNAAYFALCAFAGPRRAVRNGVLLGIGGGLGAVALPGPLGLSDATTNRMPVTRALTIGLYAAGGFVAGCCFAAFERDA